MGLHLIAIIGAKLHLLSHCRTPLLIAAGLICPFLIKLSLGFRVIRGGYIDLIDASTLFIFQLNQIAFDDADHQPAHPGNGRHRWQRALRLVCQRLRSEQLDEESIHTLTMLSL